MKERCKSPWSRRSLLIAVAWGGLASVIFAACATPTAGTAVTPDAPFRQGPPAGKADTPFFPPTVREARLPNGIRVLLAEGQSSPVVALSVAVSRGAAAAPPSIANLAYITLYAGTAVRDRSHIATGFQQLGAIGATTLDYDTFAFHYTVLPSGRQKALSLLAEMLQKPAVSEAEFARDQSWLVTSVRARSAKEVLDETVATSLYPEDHPYRLDAEGNEASALRVRRADVAGFLREQLRPDQVVVAAAGHVSWDQLYGDVVEVFGKWSGAAPPLPPLPVLSEPVRDAPLIVLDRKASNQSEIRIAALCPPIDSPDRLSFLLLSTALGGTFTSRMNLNLRERHGYGYSPHTQVETRRGPGTFTVIAAVAAARTGDALREMTAEMDRIRAAQLTGDELALAKVAFSRTIPERFSTVRATAQTLARLAAHGRPIDEHEQFARELAAIGPREIRLVAEKYLRPDQLRVVIMGDAATLVPQLGDRRVQVIPMRAD
jgi:predicted Zn-dependent peptidase